MFVNVSVIVYFIAHASKQAKNDMKSNGVTSKKNVH